MGKSDALPFFEAEAKRRMACKPKDLLSPIGDHKKHLAADDAAAAFGTSTRTAAERQRQHRARRDAGLVVLPVLIDETSVAEMLISGGLLDASDCDNRAKLTHALEEQIKILIELSRHA